MTDHIHSHAASPMLRALAAIAYDDAASFTAIVQKVQAALA